MNQIFPKFSLQGVAMTSFTRAEPVSQSHKGNRIRTINEREGKNAGRSEVRWERKELY